LTLYKLEVEDLPGTVVEWPAAVVVDWATIAGTVKADGSSVFGSPDEPVEK